VTADRERTSRGEAPRPNIVVWFAAALGVWLSCQAPLAAHRLDEYLQATRIALGSDVRLEIDLTPGTDVASAVFALVDADRSGDLSDDEQAAYAASVLSATAIEFDGQPATLKLVSSRFPVFEEMARGEGTIRLEAVAGAPGGLRGQHQLYYRNTHQTRMSVYLVNALVPPAGTRILRQERDAFQHELRLDYATTNPIGWRMAGALGAAAAFASVLGLTRYRRNRS